MPYFQPNIETIAVYVLVYGIIVSLPLPTILNFDPSTKILHAGIVDEWSKLPTPLTIFFRKILYYIVC